MSKVTRRAGNLARRLSYRLHDAVRPTVSPADILDGGLARLIPERIEFSQSEAESIAIRNYLEHRFDVLGSGWVNVRHGMRCLGFHGVLYEDAQGRSAETCFAAINGANHAASRRVRDLISDGYVPIDWHLDFKSGYRWPEDAWYRDIRLAGLEGVDIKVPWELSRAHHLPELAIAYSVQKQERYKSEFRNQILDWIAANPPRFGVNWACTMDVGIRVANWLIAFDLFRAAGAGFDEEFQRVLSASIHDHAWHIVQNLEWAEERRANHYLANVCGLLVAAAFLPADRRTDAWLAFSIQELTAETERQFLDDGGHFEASTSYHGLCGEMVAVCAALCEALPRSRVEAVIAAEAEAMKYGPGLRLETTEAIRARYSRSGKTFSADFYSKLHRAALFSRDMTKPDGSTAQIGDNDSGRFLRLGGWVVEGTVAECRARYQNLERFADLPDASPYAMQPPQNQQQWLAWESALSGDALDDESRTEAQANALALAKALVISPVVPSATNADRRAHGGTDPDEYVKTFARTAVSHRLSSTYRHEGAGLFDGAVRRSYPDFGVYVIRSRRHYLLIRCGNATHDGAGVHAHEDQLAIELLIEGGPAASDPGTYVYTPSASLRNAYRSAIAHAAPSTSRESGGGNEDEDRRAPFGPPAQSRGECIAFTERCFVGRARTGGGEVLRQVSFDSNGIRVDDYYRLAPPWRPASTDPFHPARQLPHSPAYGVRVAL